MTLSKKLWLSAGAIGLALVLVYSLLYYRVLGLLTALSLVASGAMVFAILVLLGRYIGYTLDLAGIAGLIIGIGTTADSFVVFFERIKDEIRHELLPGLEAIIGSPFAQVTLDYTTAEQPAPQAPVVAA